MNLNVMSNLSPRKARYMETNIKRHDWFAAASRVKSRDNNDEYMLETNAPTVTIDNAAKLYDNMCLSV